MSYEAIAQQHLDRLVAFVDRPDETLMSLRVAAGGARLATRMISRLDRDQERRVGLFGTSVPFVDAPSFLLGTAAALHRDLTQADSTLTSLGLSLRDLIPEHWRKPGSKVTAPEIADVLEATQRRLDPHVERLLLVVTPAAVEDPSGLAATLRLLATALHRPEVKVLLVEEDQPVLEPLALERPRQIVVRTSPPAVIAHPVARVVVVPPGTAPPADWRAARGPAVRVPLSGALLHRWAFVRAAERVLPAVEEGATPVVDVRAHSRPVSRWVQALDRRLRAAQSQALVRIDLGATPHRRLARELIARLTADACSPRITFWIEAPPELKLLPPRGGHVVVHRIAFDGEQVVQGYEAKLAQPALPAAERLRALCMLSSLLRTRSSALGRGPVDMASEAVDLAETGPPEDRLVALMTLGNALLSDDEPTRARDAYARAVALSLEIESLPFAAQALGQVGIAHVRANELEPAVASFSAAADAYRRLGQAMIEGQMLIWRGDAERRRGDVGAALMAYEAALAQLSHIELEQASPAELLAQAHERLALLHEQGGDASAADEHRRRAKERGSDGKLIEAF